jgi:hypothetical protein
MRRRRFLQLAFNVTAARGLSAAEPVTDLLARLASALSQDNVRAFLANFDPNMPDYEKLDRYVSALLSDYEVGSSVEVATDRDEDGHRVVGADWILEIRPKSSTGRSEQRHKTVELVIEQRKGKWIITALRPPEFFAAPSP